MFGSNILEVVIGIIFIYILVSTICTAVREGIESFMKTRAAYLEQGIRQLLSKDGQANTVVTDLFNHPLVSGLFHGDYTAGKNASDPKMLARGKNLPSYIPSKNFASGLIDVVAGKKDTPGDAGASGAPVLSLESLKDAAVKLTGAPQVQKVMLTAIDAAQGDINKVQGFLEAWYNSGMDRVSGWYKRSTQWIIFWIALSVTVLLNVNTITLVDYLATNDAARKSVVERASAAAKDRTVTTDYSKVKGELAELKLPIGWSNGWSSAQFRPADGKVNCWTLYLGPLLGWLFTAFAATLGAPFWFDLLNKVMVIRSTVKPHEKSGEKSSRDS
jgi:hypothetical protein